MALFCGNMVSVVTLFWLPTYLPTIGVIQNHLKTNPQLVNLILVGYALAMGIAMVTSDAIVKRFFLGRQKQVAFVSGIIGALALYVMTKTTSLVLIVVLLYLSTYMLMFVFAIVVLAPHFIVAQTKQSLIAPDMISSAYATINIMAFVGAMVGNYVVARIADKIGFAAGFGALAVPFVLMSVCLFFLPRLAKK
ncbi:MFS transporter [Ligilactobacillus sp. Marseille-Q7487]|uniref:MFS transporter n=1 Tax=Ligilactobacillus sp. Marseille-Q7487 TaxID=3022128 RepID=UPI0024A9DAEB|nr:MFS transporter [Ligilactobacillus sp. Marseille-Q7487]